MNISLCYYTKKILISLIFLCIKVNLIASEGFIAHIFSQCKNSTCIQKTAQNISLQDAINKKDETIKGLMQCIGEEYQKNETLKKSLEEEKKITTVDKEKNETIETLKQELVAQQKTNLSHIRTVLLQRRIIALMGTIILGLSAYIWKIRSTCTM